MTFVNYAAGVLPAWNQLMFISFYLMNPAFWIQDDPDDIDPGGLEPGVPQ